MRGLEPPHLTALDPKSSVSAISPHPHVVMCNDKIKVVRPSGFEPETARLEGVCSIQLSYGRVYKMVRPIGLEPITVGSEVRNSIQLSYGRLYFIVLLSF